MPEIEIKKLPESEIEIAGEISVGDFEICREQAVKLLSQGIKINGFRQGNIPEKILTEKIGEGEILEAMAEIALRKEYPKILEENKIFAIGHPQITITKIAKNNPLGFKIKTAVVPEIQLPDYKKIASEIKEDKKENMTDEEKIKEKGKRRVKILEKIANATSIEIPKIILEAEKKNGDENNAEKRIKFSMVLGEIAKNEKMEISREELGKETGKIMEYYKNTEALGGIDEGRVRDYAYGILMNEKVFKLLESC